eukprot:TRINITY_DN3452_c0_g2_i3.p1 TRINITY_DN3452_c0_g2~~TRINITY_DN3452_c0_g2_i3.p1  ORF type:complete len:432 (+),score=67.42 TRINITY_DN3452_c0_g2_i3:41-1336(+)
MVKRKVKKKSKRKTLKEKNNLIRSRASRAKKLKKLAKKFPGLKRPPKDPGIPNKLPYKFALLEEIQKEKESRTHGIKKYQDNSTEPTFTVQNTTKSKNPSLAKLKHFREVINMSDIIVEVLDARDPLGTRCVNLERKIHELFPDKKLILLLNKADLVPRKNIEKWLKYLRRELPTFIFASPRIEKNSSKFLTANMIGKQSLMTLFENYLSHLGSDSHLNVGLIGIFNVGKTSVINGLKNERVLGVGSSPGVTLNRAEVQLTDRITLIDSPGIPLSDTLMETELAIRNCKNVTDIKDPISVVEVILTRCDHENLLQIYKIPDFDDVGTLLLNVARKKGIMEGENEDIEATARIIIKDWLGGVIPIITKPPSTTDAESVVEGEVLSQWNEELSISKIIEIEESDLSGLNQDFEETFNHQVKIRVFLLRMLSRK